MGSEAGSRDVEIVVTAGPIAGRRIDVDRELIIGRQDADITIEDPEVSRRHAVIRPSGDGVEIEDLDSLNGTLVNNLPIKKATRLAVGDVVELGETVIRVEGTAVPADVEIPAAPPGATQMVSGAAKSYAYSGQRFLLGIGEGFYGIWDRASLSTPVRRFPKSPDGWEQAWRAYTDWEPSATQVEP